MILDGRRPVKRASRLAIALDYVGVGLTLAAVCAALVGIPLGILWLVVRVVRHAWGTP